MLLAKVVLNDDHLNLYLRIIMIAINHDKKIMRRIFKRSGKPTETKSIKLIFCKLCLEPQIVLLYSYTENFFYTFFKIQKI